LEHAVRTGRIVIANLAKGAIGETPAFLTGALLLAHARRDHGPPSGSLMGRQQCPIGL